MEPKKNRIKTIVIAIVLLAALAGAGLFAGWLISGRGAAGTNGERVVNSQSVGGGPDSGAMPPDAKQVPEDQLKDGGEITFSS